MGLAFFIEIGYSGWVMAYYKEKLIKLACGKCKRVNYMTRKNKKKVERKIEFKKYCNWCKAQTVHKEAKK